MAMQHQSKFRQGRGQRAQANKLTAKPSMEREEQLEEKVAPGIHDQVESMEEEGDEASQHGPAHEIHVMHDHAAGRHHVHSVHSDGFQSHSDHPSAHHAHHHAAKMAGVNLPEPEEHAEPGDEEEYAEPLD